MINAIKWIGKQTGIIFIASILYIVFCHIPFFTFTQIFFYDSILRVLIVAIILGIVEVILRKRLKLDSKDIFISLSVFMLVNLLWLLVCIISLDRSLSVFILCYMDEYQNDMSEEDIEKVFQEIFVEKYGMLERRFHEQIKTGNISCEDGKYELTDRGRGFVKIFRIMSHIYNIDKRFTEPLLINY